MPTPEQPGDDGRHLRAVPDESQQDDIDLDAMRKQLEAAGAPAELLTSLDGVTDPDEFLQRIAEAMPEPDTTPDAVIEGFADLLTPETTPLEAELAGADFLGMVRRAAPDVDVTRELLADLLASAEKSAEPHGLAMLRAVAAAGAPGVRDAANESAAKLSAAGVAEPPWRDRLGKPEFDRAFGYRDDDGGQEAIATVFHYDNAEHAVVVLIDHGMGGGVKDIFFSDQTHVIRSEYERASEAMGIELHDHGRAQAHHILASALEQPSCAEHAEQLDDVLDYRDLLRRRVEALA
ncbi:MAG: hypothetical protein GEU97_02305 [Actinophytocola sp.]|nr:hypothetical protein [Actinophytocola sp.]